MTNETNPYDSPESSVADDEKSNEQLKAKNKTVRKVVFTVLGFYLVTLSGLIISVNDESVSLPHLIAGILGGALPFIIISILLSMACCFASFKKEWKTWKVILVTLMVTFIVAKIF